jgi:RNA polymerase sigma-70 factor (ECF subfamily)
MDKESQDWVQALCAEGSVRNEALTRLHSLLLRVARAEGRRRKGNLPPQTVAELDDLCMQATNDALAAITVKLGSFQGLSRFTTWASKFVILEVSSRVRRHAWRDRRIEWSDSSWEQLPSSATSSDLALEQQEKLSLLRKAIAELPDRQRMILRTVVLEEVPIDVVAERLRSSRGAIYKVLYDARAKLRQALTQYARPESVR